MKSLGIKVFLKNAEKIRKELFEKNLVNKYLKIKNDLKFLYIPVIENIKIENTEIIEMDFEMKKKKPTNYKEIVNIPLGLKTLLPTSFDRIGGIIIIKIPDDLLNYSKKIGDSFLIWKNIKSVANDYGVKGESRIRDIQIIAGNNNTETIHKENGLVFKLDISKVYFSPRLAMERIRVQKQIKENEIIIDMFSGIGPFTILIAKFSNPKKIFAIDINEYAIYYLKENIKRNKVSNITPICGDAKIINKDLEKADRIIMNLPHSSFEFLISALSKLKSTGVIHYYEIIDKDCIVECFERVKKLIMENGFKIKKYDIRIVKSYSAGKIHLAYDFLLKKIDLKKT